MHHALANIVRAIAADMAEEDGRRMRAERERQIRDQSRDLRAIQQRSAERTLG